MYVVSQSVLNGRFIPLKLFCWLSPLVGGSLVALFGVSFAVRWMHANYNNNLVLFAISWLRMCLVHATRQA